MDCRIRQTPAVTPAKPGDYLVYLYHDCDQNFVDGMISFAQRDGVSIYEFACEVLEFFEGNEKVLPICRAMIEAIPEGSEALNYLRHVILSTGVTSGEYGFAEAYETKARKLSEWLTDRSIRVQSFAKEMLAVCNRWRSKSAGEAQKVTSVASVISTILIECCCRHISTHDSPHHARRAREFLSPPRSFALTIAP